MSAVTSASSPATAVAAVKNRQPIAYIPKPTLQRSGDSARYAKCVEVSKRIRWDIDADVIRGREFDFTNKLLPESLSLVDRLPFLDTGERRLLSQIQGRTYANIFGLVERFISAKILEVSRDHWLGDQTALEARFGYVYDQAAPIGEIILGAPSACAIEAQCVGKSPVALRAADAPHGLCPSGLTGHHLPWPPARSTRSRLVSSSGCSTSG